MAAAGVPPADPGDGRPADAPLRVGHDREANEFVEFWFQPDKDKDPTHVFTNPKVRRGTIFGFGYVMRRSSGAACHNPSGRRICKKIHLCSEWPCPSDHRLADGSVDYSKHADYQPHWHLVRCEDGWPAGAEAAAAAEAPPEARVALAEAASGLHLGPAEGPAAAEPSAEARVPFSEVAAAPHVGPVEGSAAAGPSAEACVVPAHAHGADAIAEAVSAVEAALKDSGAGAATSAEEAALVAFPKPAPLAVRGIAEPVLPGPENVAMSAPCASAGAVAAAPWPAGALSEQGQECFDKLMKLSRSIRRPKAWIGHSAFVVFALLRKVRVYVWEGEARVDLCKVVLPPWKLEELSREPAVDAIACCAVPRDSGPPDWTPVSRDHPLWMCSHFIAGVPTDFVDATLDTSTVDGFYSALGVYIVSTVADGDCGLDCMLRMTQDVSTPEARSQLRQDSSLQVSCFSPHFAPRFPRVFSRLALPILPSSFSFFPLSSRPPPRAFLCLPPRVSLPACQEIADYIVERIRFAWFLDVMVLTQEVTTDEVQALRRLQSAFDDEELVPQPGATAAAVASSGGSGVVEVDGERVCEELVQAIQWYTGLSDSACALDVARELMPAERDEQLLRYRNRGCEHKAAAQKQKRAVVPSLLSSRMEIAGAFDEHIRSAGWSRGKRVPYGGTRSFLDGWEWGSLSGASPSRRRNALLRWHKVFLSSGYASAVAGAVRQPTRLRRSRLLKWKGRKTVPGQGPHRKCSWLRQAMFEWWSSIRHSVDWKAIKQGMRSDGKEPKKIARFTQSMLQTKATQLMSEYVTEHLRLGTRPAAVKLRSRWWASWRKDFGLSMRHPNRKYKCPLPVLEERLERGWLNVFRVRAACVLLTQQDPEMENFDQSPFHHNETGSAGAKTLAVAGVPVPLVECHGATRERWTANLMTMSDKDRLRREGPPPMECMFKAEGGGEKLRPRLEEHLRRRGFGAWVSAATSAKGSYRTPDVIVYLERHLSHMPEPPQQRGWRIMMADDHGPHLSPLVSKLCWSRGYVFIPHGGGVTPILQTVDTHLNQHVKREYVKREGAALLKSMRLGQCVPQLDKRDCIDLMADVMSDMRLHLAAAEGYWETGFKANIWDADLDARICKEAGHFWRKLGMRRKVAAAVAEVEEEVKAGRLRWTYKDIMRLILPHPRRGHCDDVFVNLGDETALDEGDMIWHGMEGAEDAGEDLRSSGGADGGDADDAPDEDERDGGDSDGGWSAVCEFDFGWEAPSSGAAAAGESPVASPPGQSTSLSQTAEQTSDMMRTYASMAEELRSWGDIAGATFMEVQLNKERRRVRELSREDPGVQRALTAYEDAREATLRREKQQRDVEARRREELNRLGADVKKARKLLRAQQAKLADAEEAIDIRHRIKHVGLSELGAGLRSCGGAAGRTARLEALSRLARLGSGLSAAQRSDFDWFRREWDAAGMEDFGEKWPETFAAWLQNVIDEHLGGNPRAFSVFVHNETRRRLSGSLALALPAAGGV